MYEYVELTDDELLLVYGGTSAGGGYGGGVGGGYGGSYGGDGGYSGPAPMNTETIDESVFSGVVWPNEGYEDYESGQSVQAEANYSYGGYDGGYSGGS